MSAKSHHRGRQRLRVLLALDEQNARPAGMWLVDSPAVQRTSLEGPYIARIDVGGTLVLLQSLGDPFETRAIQRPEQIGHYYSRVSRTTVHIDVPIETDDDITRIAITIADLSGVGERPTEWEAVAGLLARAPSEVRWLPTVESADLMKHRDWRQLVE
jgi:hypothetical protein